KPLSGCGPPLLTEINFVLRQMAAWQRRAPGRNDHNKSWEDAMAVSKALTVNSQQVEISIDDPDMPLLYALRDNLGLHGPRFGCGLGQCGACTVHIDGKAVRSCVTPLSK